MQLKIIEPKLGDGHRINLLAVRAFDKDTLDCNLFPRLAVPASSDPPPEVDAVYYDNNFVNNRHPNVLPYREKLWDEEIQKEDPRRYLRMMVDEDVKDSEGRPRVVGYSHWVLPKPSGDKEENAEIKQKNEAEGDKSEKKEDAKKPIGVNAELWERIVEEGKVKKVEYMGPDEDYWYLGRLFTDPAYLRKGIGRALLQDGMQQAEEQGKAVYLEATPAGYPLYKAAGFGDLGELVLDYLEFKGEIEYKIIPMVKRPSGDGHRDVTVE